MSTQSTPDFLGPMRDTRESILGDVQSIFSSFLTNLNGLETHALRHEQQIAGLLTEKQQENENLARENRRLLGLVASQPESAVSLETDPAPLQDRSAELDDLIEQADDAKARLGVTEKLLDDARSTISDRDIELARLRDELRAKAEQEAPAVPVEQTPEWVAAVTALRAGIEAEFNAERADVEARTQRAAREEAVRVIEAAAADSPELQLKDSTEVLRAALTGRVDAPAGTTQSPTDATDFFDFSAEPDSDETFDLEFPAPLELDEKSAGILEAHQENPSDADIDSFFLDPVPEGQPKAA